MNPLFALAAAALAAEPIHVDAAVSAQTLKNSRDWVKVGTFALGSHEVALHCRVPDGHLRCRASSTGESVGVDVQAISVEKGTVTLGPLRFKNVEGLDSETEVVEFADRDHLEDLEK